MDSTELKEIYDSLTEEISDRDSNWKAIKDSVERHLTTSNIIDDDQEAELSEDIPPTVE